MISSMAKRRTFNNIIIEPSNANLQLVELGEGSWVKVGYIVGLTMDEFEQLWNDKPIQRARIKIRGNTIECPRFTKNYLLPYTFSGQNNLAIEKLPLVLNKIYQLSKNMNPKLNQCLVNFYEADGSIGKHCNIMISSLYKNYFFFTLFLTR